jgi:LuxR family maltose regulon positive regulatory protein
MAITGVPRVPEGVRVRSRLSARFGGPQALVVARAPAGYGKTVAMAHWAAATEATGVWIRFRDNQVGAASLVQLIGAELDAAGLLAPGNPLLSASDALAGGADPWWLLRHGLRARAGTTTLALDGLERLADESTAGLMDALLDLPALEIRATARRSGLSDESALALRLDRSVIEPTELALTAAETADALSADPGSPAVERVLQSGGLPLFAKLMAAGDHGGSEPGDGDLGALLDSFVRIELAGGAWDEQFLAFVTATSVADSLDHRLAAEIAAIARLRPAESATTGSTGSTGSTTGLTAEEVVALLDRAESDGLGLWSGNATTPTGRQEFVYTPLVREAFERRLRAAKPAHLTSLVGAVAIWELERSRPYAALRRAVSIGDWQLVNRVVREHWNEILRNHGPQLRILFHRTSLVELRRQPLVAMLLALEYNRSGDHRLRALEYFALAGYAARTQRQRSSPADRALLRAIETAALRVSGRAESALGAALDARDVLLEMSAQDRDHLGRTEPTLHNQIGTTLFSAGRFDEALESFARATAIGASRGLKGGLQGTALTAGTLAVAGDLGEAAHVAHEAAGLDWPEGWLTGYPGSFLQLAEALLALERWDADEADRRIRSLDPHRSTIEHWALLAHVDAVVGLLRGEPGRALLRLEGEIARQRKRSSAATRSLARLAETRSLLLLAAGDAEGAKKALGKAPSSIGAARHGIAAARIDLACGQPEDALRHLLRVRELADSRARGDRTTLRAAALALLGDDDSYGDRAAPVVHEAVAFLTDRGQGLALALVPTEALDAMIRIAAAAGQGDDDLLRRARRHAGVSSLSAGPVFTAREAALVRALPEARDTAELAAMLSVSPNTIKTQLRSVYRKLGVASRSEAIAALAARDRPEPPA